MRTHFLLDLPWRN